MEAETAQFEMTYEFEGGLPKFADELRQELELPRYANDTIIRALRNVCEQYEKYGRQKVNE